MPRKTTAKAARRGRRPRSREPQLTQVVGLVQPQPTSVPAVKGRLARFKPSARAKQASPVARRVFPKKEAHVESSSRAAALEEAITEMLKLKRNSLTPQAAQEILRILVNL